jgi:hypothetical protein
MMRRAATVFSVALVSIALLAPAAFAGKPEHAGGGKGGGKGNGKSSPSSKSSGGGSGRSGSGSSGSSGQYATPPPPPPPPQQPYGGGGGYDGRHDDYDYDRGVVVFSGSQRHAYHDWWEHEYGRGHCPPGLAKKRNGCLPPGLAKKRYRVGYPCPSGVVIGPIPPSLAVVLGPPPRGYYYGMIDGDVVKLAVGTALVVDALDGMLD